MHTKKQITPILFRGAPNAKRGRRHQDPEMREWEFYLRVRHHGKYVRVPFQTLYILEDGTLDPESLPKGQFLYSAAIPITLAAAYLFFRKHLRPDNIKRFFAQPGGRQLTQAFEDVKHGKVHLDRVIELSESLRWDHGPIEWFSSEHPAKIMPKTPKSKPVTADPVVDQDVKTILDLNKRLLYEMKQIKEKLQTLEGKFDALAYGGPPANRPFDPLAPGKRAGSLKGRVTDFEDEPDPEGPMVVPNAPVKGHSRAPVPSGGDLGLQAAKIKPAPGTRPQQAVQRHKVQEPQPGKAGIQIQNPSEFGDAMAFNDMMNGR